jgi:hypothetical protein
MGRSKHHVELSNGRFLKFFTAGGDTVTCYAFKSREEWQVARSSGRDWRDIDLDETERIYWIKAEVRHLRQQIAALENIKGLAESLSDGLDEFGCDYPDAWGELQNHLDNAIVDYHDKWGKRWPKMPDAPYSFNEND